MAERQEVAARSESVARMSIATTCAAVSCAASAIALINKNGEEEMSESSSKSGGIGFLTVIGIVFVLLKILAVEPVASWSWLWVLCPFWAPIAIVVFVVVIFAIIAHR